MAGFVSVTKTTSDASKVNAVIMGRKTWDSIPPQARPLRGRLNVIVTRQPERFSGLPKDKVCAVSSFQAALDVLETDQYRDRLEKVFVIGGAEIFKIALQHPLCEEIHLTEVLKPFDCDVFMPEIDPSLGFDLVEEGEVEMDGPENNIPIQYLVYRRPVQESSEANDASSSEVKSVMSHSLEVKGAPSVSPRHEEHQYLDLIRDIIANGKFKMDRTQVGTYSKFGAMMRFSLRDGKFPLLTTKRVFLRGIVEELIWFIRGSTNAQELKDKNVHIWDGNASRDFLDKCGLWYRNENDLGPVYGFQWRHFGARYVDCHWNYDGQGVDQLTEVIETIRKNPNSRRILMSAWNPVDIPKMALPPCHVLSQFFVADGELSCILYQRSCDMGLGVPFNIASYALLTCFIAKLTGLKPGDFIHMMGDTHVYSNHVEALKIQLQREPRPFPTIKLRDRPEIKSITDFVAEDVIIEGYDPHPAIKMDMAV